MPSLRLPALAAAAALALSGGAALADHGPDHGPSPARAVLATAVADLRTKAGADLVGATWRYRNADLVPVDFTAAGPDHRPGRDPVRTHDISPKAGAADFDDSSWPVIGADTLEARRGTGRFSLGWYRLSFTVPERLGETPTTGGTFVFETVVDDYAEIWVDGRLARVLGSSEGAHPAGWNSVQRVTLTHDARPGQRFQLALLAANGPLSDPPSNYVWIRSATLDFYAPGRLPVSTPAALEVVRFDPAIDEIVPAGSVLEHLAGGFAFTEGPVWVPTDGGYLLFSDPNNNRIYRWSERGGVSIYRTKSGYSGVDIGRYRQPGSNGLTLDGQGRLVIAEHGNRRISRLEPNGVLTVLADRADGHRLNSPNDVVLRRDGAVYFTDPFFGLPGFGADPAREHPRTGVHLLREGKVTEVVRDLTGPNGLAFSPDERFLYVGNWDDHRKVVVRYPVQADGTLGAGVLFADLTKDAGADAIDGVKVDTAGRVYVSGPGGLWIFAADGKRLGLLRCAEHPHNMAWGGPDYRTLYLTAQTGLYRLRLNATGAGSHLRPST